MQITLNGGKYYVLVYIMKITAKPKSNKGLIIGIILFLLIVIIIIVLVIVMRRKSANAPASPPSASPPQPTPPQPIPPQPIPPQPTPPQPTPPQPTPCPPYAIFPSTDIYGFDIPGNPITDQTEQQCQAQCTSNPSCQWYNFKADSNLCYLKQGTPTPTFNYGFKNTDPNSSCIQHLSNPGYDIPGQKFNIGNAIPNLTEAQCYTQCDNNAACQWYSYDTNANNCYLKKGGINATTDTGFKR